LQALGINETVTVGHKDGGAKTTVTSCEPNEFYAGELTTI